MDTRKFKKPYKKQFHSSKQYDHFKTLGAGPLPQFPKTLLAPYLFLVQTKQNCTAYSGVNERYGVTGRQYDPEAFWKDELKFLGIVDAPSGVDLDTKMQVGIKVGFVPPGTTDHIDQALSYFWVKKLSGYDWFDSFRIAIFQLYQKYGKVVPITCGVNWYSEWDFAPNGILTDNPSRLLGGHDIDIPGLETYVIDNQDYLVSPSSWGQQYGDNGIFRISRTIFNKYFQGYGAAYWSDDPDLEPSKMNRLIALLKNLVVLYQRLIGKMVGYPPPPPTVPTVPPVVTPTGYLWDTPELARHSVRVICDEAGLSVADKNVLCACVQVESNFNPKAVHQNKARDAAGNAYVSSTDWGIAQINDYWHIGPGKDFPSTDFVLTNPEDCIRWMAKMWLARKQSLWCSYTSGAYKKYL